MCLQTLVCPTSYRDPYISVRMSKIKNVLVWYLRRNIVQLCLNALRSSTTRET